ncbi:ORF44 [callitrichine gammaherpesvirus 3]|uniref:ORF44 n=1 Tax=callitrichine gammaherpesvirus 3 TaxID=106331 RepID=Q993G6_9GAMA|nr:ORF44 [callitrichine gammaherpesvirus 3]AAK38252.1 ORF44 [callitrichine gammaherpesvirus 3]
MLCFFTILINLTRIMSVVCVMATIRKNACRFAWLLISVCVLALVIVSAYYMSHRFIGRMQYLTWVEQPSVDLPNYKFLDFNVSTMIKPMNESPHIDMPHWTVKPKTFSFGSRFEKPDCIFCNTRVTTFSFKNLCFYFTQQTYTWEHCFSVCAQLHNCTFFYGPNANTSPIVQKNLKNGESLWVGIYRDSKSALWKSLTEDNCLVDDIYGSHCTYIWNKAKGPSSHYECNFHKQCLCASIRY